MSVMDWIELHDEQRVLAEKIAKILKKDIVQVLITPHEELMNELVELIENGR